MAIRCDLYIGISSIYIILHVTVKMPCKFTKNVALLTKLYI